MSRWRFEDRSRQRGSIALSIAIHVIVIALIASITFRYPISALLGPSREQLNSERIQYVRVQPEAPRAGGGVGAGGGAVKRAPKKIVPQPRLVAPSAIPSVLPPVAPPSASALAGVDTGNGVGGGNGTGAPGMATGVDPALPDPRIELRPNLLRLPLTTAQRNDSAVKAIYMAYREAEIAAEENRGRSPRDWTFEHNGQKFGLDSQWVYLGKFKIPSAILAALPFNYGGVDGSRIIQGRNAAWIQNDIYMHSQGMSEDDFRAAVKRIRERKEREKREQDDKAPAKATPIIP
jgi:hypothetical protein